ncbi:MAG: GatB/YqeY domain-containing protein, partial [Anaerolineales bacterium]
TFLPTRYNEIMDLKLQLETALKEAMKAGDDVRKRTIRMVLAAIRQVEIDRQIILDETAVISIIQKEIKIRNEAVEEAQRANRPDIVSATEAEISVLKGYLPEALSENELIALAKAVIVETGAASPSDLGKVMKLLMPRVAGRTTGVQVSNVVRQLLQK